MRTVASENESDSTIESSAATCACWTLFVTSSETSSRTSNATLVSSCDSRSASASRAAVTAYGPPASSKLMSSMHGLPASSPAAAGIMAIAASACGHVGGGLDEGAPALFDVTPLPDDHRAHPGDDEQAHHRVAELAEVERVQPLPHRTLERQLV